ncbi:hypothetical protein Q8A67_025669 [Cirrhinus molitorella]|uniref:Uncharacterized protein n=1 Tax=Cirrhinus molitorella TaxID=172907 RepID=A0AA88T8H1_9TELE|nr:hypothetical protein Q8A67_025669 [Cirrhinus molitorella]
MVKIINEGSAGAPAETIHPCCCGWAPQVETTPIPAPQQLKSLMSMPVLAALGSADDRGVGSLDEPDSSSALETANDMLSSMASSSLPPKETRSLTATEGRWSGWEKRTGEASLGGEGSWEEEPGRTLRTLSASTENQGSYARNEDSLPH